MTSRTTWRPRFAGLAAGSLLLWSAACSDQQPTAVAPADQPQASAGGEVTPHPMNAAALRGEMAACTPVTLDAVYSGPPARTPNNISLDDQFVFVDILDVEAYFGRGRSPRPADLRMGESFETGTPAESFQILDIDNDRRRDIRLRFAVNRLLDEGNLGEETEELTVWGWDRRFEQLYCGTAEVTVIGGEPEVLFYDNFDQENNGVGQPNYFGFTQWNVVGGSVDLIGNGFFDLYPGNGLYVDLDGSTGNAGRMETKTEFTLTPATYVLEFQLGGSQRGDTNTVEVSLGSVYSESFTLPSATPLTTYTRSIPVASTTSARIVFDHAGGDNVGLILAEVRLSRAP